MDVEGLGARAPQSVSVDVTPGDVEMAHEFARRCSSRNGYAHASGWGGGLCDGMRMYGGIDVDSTIAGLVIGKVGEIAMCKLSGVAVDFAFRDRGDGGRDLTLPSGTVQVKTSRRSFPTRLVREPAERCDWFVFATWNGLRPVVSIDGYASRAAIERLPSVWSPRGSWMNKEISVLSLLPIRQLLKIRPIHEVM